jgi:hypothetical protein
MRFELLFQWRCKRAKRNAHYRVYIRYPMACRRVVDLPMRCAGEQAHMATDARAVTPAAALRAVCAERKTRQQRVKNAEKSSSGTQQVANQRRVVQTICHSRLIPQRRRYEDQRLCCHKVRRQHDPPRTVLSRRHTATMTRLNAQCAAVHA